MPFRIGRYRQALKKKSHARQIAEAKLAVELWFTRS